MRDREADDLMNVFAQHWYKGCTNIKESEIASFMERSIVASPIHGNYDQLAGWALAVEGSPVRGVIVLFYVGDRVDDPLDASYFDMGHRRSVTDKQSFSVKAFHDKYLKDRKSKLRIDWLVKK